jgi:hypothetical protein
MDKLTLCSGAESHTKTTLTDLSDDLLHDTAGFVGAQNHVPAGDFPRIATALQRILRNPELRNSYREDGESLAVFHADGSRKTGSCSSSTAVHLVIKI